MSLQKAIVLRHRAAGYLRFDVPEALCAADVAADLEVGLRALRGVYRVSIARRAAKLSIRYQEAATDVQAIACELSALVDRLEERRETFSVSARPQQPDDARLVSLEPARRQKPAWLREQYRAIRETLTAFGVVFRTRVIHSAGWSEHPEKVAIEFFNDVVVLYLIKVHWHLITQHWLKMPWRYRYEWMTVFYLLYLLMRARQAALLDHDDSEH